MFVDTIFHVRFSSCFATRQILRLDTHEENGTFTPSTSFFDSFFLLKFAEKVIADLDNLDSSYITKHPYQLCLEGGGVQDKTSAHTHLFRNLKHRRALSARLLIPLLCWECFSVGVTIVTTFSRRGNAMPRLASPSSPLSFVYTGRMRRNAADARR